MFSFIIYDQRTGFYGAARDHIGITSLYLGRGSDGSVWIASEMKSLARDCPDVEQFKPGHCWRSDTQQYALWYAPTWRSGVLPSTPCDFTKLREAFVKAVSDSASSLNFTVTWSRRWRRHDHTRVYSVATASVPHRSSDA